MVRGASVFVAVTSFSKSYAKSLHINGLESVRRSGELRLHPRIASHMIHTLAVAHVGARAKEHRVGAAHC